MYNIIQDTATEPETIGRTDHEFESAHQTSSGLYINRRNAGEDDGRMMNSSVYQYEINVYGERVQDKNTPAPIKKSIPL